MCELMKPEFRHFSAPDTEDVVRLLNTELPDDQAHNEPVSVLRLKAQSDDLSFVATVDGVICGFVMAGFDGHRGWLYQLAVDPACRRSGIATGLVRYAMRCLQDLGCRKLNLQVREGNDQAESFYLSLGFSREQRISMGIVLPRPSEKSP